MWVSFMAVRQLVCRPTAKTSSDIRNCVHARKGYKAIRCFQTKIHSFSDAAYDRPLSLRTYSKYSLYVSFVTISVPIS